MRVVDEEFSVINQAGFYEVLYGVTYRLTNAAPRQSQDAMLERAARVAALRAVIIATADATNAYFIGVAIVSEARKGSHDMIGSEQERRSAIRSLALPLTTA